LSARLPAAGEVVNLCQNRYLFALGMVAAVLRGLMSVMPPNAMPQTLRQVRRPGTHTLALVDHADIDAGELPRFVVDRPRAPAPLAAQPRVAAHLEAVCLLTSGSTGTPQPHPKCWGALQINIGAEAQRLAELLDLPALDGLNLVATVPPQHSYGLESSVLLALLGGAAFDSGRPFYPADIALALERLPRPRGLVTTPFHLKSLLRSNVALPTIDLVLSATAPLTPQLAAEAEKACGGRLIEIYGCTEAGQVAARRTTDGELWHTLGEMRLASRVGPDGEEFVVSGGHVAEPTPLADVLDLLDARRFRLLGRSNDLIHVAGKRSSLAHLNFCLNRIEGVQDGAFWLPDEVPGAVTRPVAFVVARELDTAQIIDALRQQLEPVFVPRRVVRVPALPREATGKLTVGALHAFALAHLAGAEPPGANIAKDATDAGDMASVLAADHPVFAGHFPGAPVVPGALLLCLLFEQLARAPEAAARLGATPRIEQAKFLAPMGPGQAMRCAFEVRDADVEFTIHAGSVCAVRGRLAPGSAIDDRITPPSMPPAPGP
jgi:acyl-CoA synthetase (AMP-forming)/AMP-acid ligase II/3-hydroxymyristoyl/3-hydroxydecanoyl-(acyl carrier protein) dehydratase